MSIYIDNCEYKFEYKCPLEWENLKKTKDSKIRFCNKCNKNVYRCITSEDIDKHLQLNHCVAVNEPNMPMGLMIPPADDLSKLKDLK